MMIRIGAINYDTLPEVATPVNPAPKDTRAFVLSFKLS